MAEVVLKRKETEVLVINIEDKKYSLPLGGSIPFKKLKKLKTEEGIFEFLAEHLPAEVIDTLTTSDITQIFTAWSEATRKATGATPGEFIASRSS